MFDVFRVGQVPYIELKLDAPQESYGLNQYQYRTPFSLALKEKGTYRIWTSLLEGTVKVVDPYGNTIVTGQQQVTFTVDAGTYYVIVELAGATGLVTYRIRSAKIG